MAPSYPITCSGLRRIRSSHSHFGAQPNSTRRPLVDPGRRITPHPVTNQRTTLALRSGTWLEFVVEVSWSKTGGTPGTWALLFKTACSLVVRHGAPDRGVLESRTPTWWSRDTAFGEVRSSHSLTRYHGTIRVLRLRLRRKNEKKEHGQSTPPRFALLTCGPSKEPLITSKAPAHVCKPRATSGRGLASCIAPFRVG